MEKVGGSGTVAHREGEEGTRVGGPTSPPKRLVTICAECKRLIGPVGAAVVGEQELVSHGICPECARKLYGSYFEPRTRKAHSQDRAKP